VLALGFGELAARRGRLASNLLVLDEAMHLDDEGCARFAALLRALGRYSTILVVVQPGTAAARALDRADVVVKRADGTSAAACHEKHVQFKSRKLKSKWGFGASVSDHWLVT
jgi:hypothetical protein